MTIMNLTITHHTPLINMLLFLSVTTVTILLLIFISIQFDIDWLKATSWTLFGLIVFFGWIVLGIQASESSKKIPIKPIEIIKGKHIAIVVAINSDGEIIERTFRGNQIEFINDSTTFYIEKSYNMYNFVTSEYIKYEIK